MKSLSIAAALTLMMIPSAHPVSAADLPVKPAAVKLWRLKCGPDMPLPKAMFSDTYMYGDKETKDFTFSCYLIRHGDKYMIWDAGLPAQDGTRMTDQLHQLGISPDQVSFIGISHFHFDHIGQAADFPKAQLLIGAADFDAVKAGKRLPDNSTDSAVRLAPWVSGGAPVEPLGTRDHDVFGDGSVMVMNTPGHTPGHHSLLVRLPGNRNFLLSGDLYHFPENRAARGVPIFNTSRGDTLASMTRFEDIAKRLNATVIIQHEPKDIAKLPKFPRPAE